MLSEFIATIGTLSPSVIYSALRALVERGQERTVTLRMMAPERRWSVQRAERSKIRGKRRKRTTLRKESQKLWTLRKCQMQLLAENSMLEVDSNPTRYLPAPRLLNHSPEGPAWQPGNYGMDNGIAAFILLRTLERRPEMLPGGAPEIYRDGPRIQDGPEKILSYRRGSLVSGAQVTPVS